MPKRMLVTLPDHDITTYYLRAWGKKAVKYAEDHSIEVTSLDRDKANRKNVESYLSNLPFGMVFLNGHGDENTVQGYNNEPIIIAGKNESKLKSTITYAISCSSAMNLGDASIKAGAICYVGYAQDFMFTLDESNSTHPLEDKLAGLFLEHTNIFMSAIAKGSSVSEAYDKAKGSLRESIMVAESSGNRTILSWLLWDYYAFVAKGDISSRL